MSYHFCYYVLFSYFVCRGNIRNFDPRMTLKDNVVMLCVNSQNLKDNHPAEDRIFVKYETSNDNTALQRLRHDGFQM